MTLPMIPADDHFWLDGPGHVHRDEQPPMGSTRCGLPTQSMRRVSHAQVLVYLRNEICQACASAGGRQR